MRSLEKNRYTVIAGITLVAGFLHMGSAQAQSGALESYLTDAQKKEIEARAKAETMEYEARKAQEQVAVYKKQLEGQIIELRRSAESLRMQQERFREQLSALNNENIQLSAKQAEIAREVSMLEEQARRQEVEALKTKTRLDTSKAILADNIAKLEQRRKQAQDTLAQNKASIDQWNKEISLVQAEIVEAQMTALNFEKELLQLQGQGNGLSQKLDNARQQRDKMEQEREALKEKVAQYKKDNQLLAKEIKSEKIQAEEIRLAIGKLGAEYNAEAKKFVKLADELALAKEIARQEKQKQEEARGIYEQALSKAKQKNEELTLELVKLQGEGIDAKVAMTDSKIKLTSELVYQAGIKPFKDEKEALKPMVTSTLPTKDAPRREVAQSEFKDWRLVKLCNLYEQPNTKSAQLFKIPGGSKVQAALGPKGFVKAIGPNGLEGYILELCGVFD
jgi:chromosome segregation ATPase